MNCEELITILLEEPLFKVNQTDTNFVVVLDALDECTHDSKDELLKALRKKLSCFPSWIRFIVTIRESTKSALGSPTVVEIRPEDQSNIKDLGLFFSFEVKALYPQYDNDDNDADLVQKLVYMTKGLFLVAFFVIDFLKKENVTSPEKVLETFPNGISSVYENYFSRLKEVLLPYISEEERFYKMLEAVVATNNPLPKDVFHNILCVKGEREVPRQERKARKDALNALHWLFPVEKDHVTVFHKSVVDWLTHKEHDFSVLVEDGNEVLASQCSDVLSDIRNGKKDLDKPLDLTDSETYALRFLWHLVEKCSLIDKADEYGFFSNIYILAALKIRVSNFDFSVLDSIMSRSLIHILNCMTESYPIHSFPHFPSCHFFHPMSFGRYLAFVLQAAYAKGITKRTTPNPLDALEKHLFPYFDEKCLLRVLAEMKNPYLLKCKEGFIAFDLTRFISRIIRTEVYMFQLDGSLVTRKDFFHKWLITTSPNISFIVAAEENGNKIIILDVKTLKVVRQYEFSHHAIETCHVFEDEQGWFIVIKGRHDNKVYVMEGLTGRVRNIITVGGGSTVVDVSCHGHIVVTRTWKQDEKLSTFTNKDGEVEKMNWRRRNYESWSEPLDRVQPKEEFESKSCSAYDIERKGKYKSKLWFVPEYRDQPKEEYEYETWSESLDRVQPKEEYISKSSSAYLVQPKGEYQNRHCSAPAYRVQPKEEYEYESCFKPLNRVQTKDKYKSKSCSVPAYCVQPKEEYKYVHKELFLYHYDRRQEPIPIYPLVEKACQCPHRLKDDDEVDTTIHVSEDGRLLAYHYKDSVFIVNTSDGSLFKRWSFAGNVKGSRLDIIFVSQSYLVIIDGRIMSVINLQKDEIEHKIYLTHSFIPNRTQYLLLPGEDGKSFNLISSHRKNRYIAGLCKMSRLVFHNLNLQGLQ